MAETLIHLARVALVLLVLYWIIRLAVAHGIQDARLTRRVERAPVDVSETIRRQRAAYGDAGEA